MYHRVIQGKIVQFVVRVYHSEVRHETSVVHAMTHHDILREHDNHGSYLEDYGGRSAPHDHHDCCTKLQSVLIGNFTLCKKGKCRSNIGPEKVRSNFGIGIPMVYESDQEDIAKGDRIGIFRETDDAIVHLACPYGFLAWSYSCTASSTWTSDRKRQRGNRRV